MGRKRTVCGVHEKVFEDLESASRNNKTSQSTCVTFMRTRLAYCVTLTMMLHIPRRVTARLLRRRSTQHEGHNKIVYLILFFSRQSNPAGPLGCVRDMYGVHIGLETLTRAAQRFGSS